MCSLLPITSAARAVGNWAAKRVSPPGSGRQAFRVSQPVGALLTFKTPLSRGRRPRGPPREPGD